MAGKAYDTTANVANRAYDTTATTANRVYETGARAGDVTYETGREGARMGASAADRAALSAEQALADAKRGYEMVSGNNLGFPVADHAKRAATSAAQRTLHLLSPAPCMYSRWKPVMFRIKAVAE